ncbi:tetratricopeptide repeat protein [Bacteroides sp.]|uniref:tetratricopeptide repeat protein n=1 Tax=Bacteroides sp. TaxID=29523 RepID=UPI0025840D50|nr:tetratricopeptide repeat protein [Bacteroides sp.]
MTSVHLQQWIEHPEMLNRDTLYELRTMVARYPYFQSLRLLYLKNLYLLHDTAFGSELRKAVLYVADRRVLFYLIEGDRYKLQAQKLSNRIDTELKEEPSVDRTLFLIDTFLATMPEEQTQPMELDYSMDYTAYLLSEDNGLNEESPQEEVPKLRGQNLIDDFLKRDEKETVEEAVPSATDTKLDAMPEQPDDAAESVEECSSSQSPMLEATAEQPIEGACQIIGADEPSEIADQAAGDDLDNEEPDEENLDDIYGKEELDDSCFTETLAKIYIKQHRYDKALEIIKKLSLNYPKKNAYFADQIRFLEKLIINAKSK